MFDLQLNLKNFLSIKEANVKSKNNITVLIAPNRAGKTQLMLLQYSIFWNFWKNFYSHKNNQDLTQINKELKEKLLNTLLLDKHKDLLDKNTYQNELSEIVKKMWGTHSILIWYLDSETFRKNKIFILKAKVKPRYSKILGKLNMEIRRFKNGSYSEIKFEIE